VTFSAIVSSTDPGATASDSTSRTPEFTRFYATKVTHPYQFIWGDTPATLTASYCGQYSCVAWGRDDHEVIVEGTTDTSGRCARLEFALECEDGTGLSKHNVTITTNVQGGTCNGCPVRDWAWFILMTYDCSAPDPATSWTYVGLSKQEYISGHYQNTGFVTFDAYPSSRLATTSASFSFSKIILYPWTNSLDTSTYPPTHVYPANWATRPAAIEVQGSASFQGIIPAQRGVARYVSLGGSPPAQMCANAGATGTAREIGQDCSSGSQCQTGHCSTAGKCCSTSGFCSYDSDCCSSACGLNSCCQ
jgi:hypothetical protein